MAIPHEPAADSDEAIREVLAETQTTRGCVIGEVLWTLADLVAGLYEALSASSLPGRPPSALQFAD